MAHGHGHGELPGKKQRGADQIGGPWMTRNPNGPSVAELTMVYDGSDSLVGGNWLP